MRSVAQYMYIAIASSRQLQGERAVKARNRVATSERGAPTPEREARVVSSEDSRRKRAHKRARAPARRNGVREKGRKKEEQANKTGPCWAAGALLNAGRNGLARW